MIIYKLVVECTGISFNEAFLLHLWRLWEYIGKERSLRQNNDAGYYRCAWNFNTCYRLKTFNHWAGVSWWNEGKDSPRKSTWAWIRQIFFWAVFTRAFKGKNSFLVVSCPDSSIFWQTSFTVWHRELSLSNVNLMYTYVLPSCTSEYELPSCKRWHRTGNLVLNVYDKHLLTWSISWINQKVF